MILIYGVYLRINLVQMNGNQMKWRRFVLSFFPRDVSNEIWELIEPVSEGFPTYSYILRVGSVGRVLVVNPTL